MRWLRILWAVTAILIWLVSLMIIESTAKQTRLGYQIHEIKVEQEKIEERNLRLQCEVATLYDLEKAQDYAVENNLKQLNLHEVDVLVEASAGN